MDLLTPNVGLAVWTILTFVLVLLVLRRYAWKPILGAMEARERGIQQLLDDAEAARAEAEATLEEYRRQLAEARAAVQQMFAEGRADAERVRNELLQNAHTDAEAIVARAHGEIHLERQKAIAEIKEQAAEIAISAASKIIEEALDEERHRRIVEEYLQEIASEPEVVRQTGRHGRSR